MKIKEIPVMKRLINLTPIITMVILALLVASCQQQPTPAQVTPAPVTSVPVTPVPVTPAPVTPVPVTPAPRTPAPVTLAPITPAVVTPEPVTPAPVTPEPVTPEPVTPASATPAAMPVPAQPNMVTFRSGAPSVEGVSVSSWRSEVELTGYIYKPEGPGPFPAVLWNHGSEKLPGWLPELGQLFTSKGYVFFVPHRRGQGRSPGDYIMDLLGQERIKPGGGESSKLLVRLHEVHLLDQTAALSYLKGLSYVDLNRVAVAGISFGGIQTMLAAGTNAQGNLGLRAAINFAGAAQTWKTSPELRDRLLTAVRQTNIPVFFIQAQNDYDLTPSRTLAAELERLGKTQKLLIFPSFGTTAQDGHEFGVRGGELWATEVFAFLDTAMRK